MYSARLQGGELIAHLFLIVQATLLPTYYGTLPKEAQLFSLQTSALNAVTECPLTRARVQEQRIITTELVSVAVLSIFT